MPHQRLSLPASTPKAVPQPSGPHPAGSATPTATPSTHTAAPLAHTLDSSSSCKATGPHHPLCRMYACLPAMPLAPVAAPAPRAAGVDPPGRATAGRSAPPPVLLPQPPPLVPVLPPLPPRGGSRGVAPPPAALPPPLLPPSRASQGLGAATPRGSCPSLLSRKGVLPGALLPGRAGVMSQPPPPASSPRRSGVAVSRLLLLPPGSRQLLPPPPLLPSLSRPSRSLRPPRSLLS